MPSVVSQQTDADAWWEPSTALEKSLVTTCDARTAASPSSPRSWCLQKVWPQRQPRVSGLKAQPCREEWSELARPQRQMMWTWCLPPWRGGVSSDLPSLASPWS